MTMHPLVRSDESRDQDWHLRAKKRTLCGETYPTYLKTFADGLLSQVTCEKCRRIWAEKHADGTQEVLPL